MYAVRLGPLTRDGGSAADVSWPGRSDVRLLAVYARLLAASHWWLADTGVRIPVRSLVVRLPSFAFGAVVSEEGFLLYPGPNVAAPLLLLPIVASFLGTHNDRGKQLSIGFQLYCTTV
jgi:hypothetical protein